MAMCDLANTNSNEWPGDEKVISTYTLEFSDGWQPPKLSAAFDSRASSRRQVSRTHPPRWAFHCMPVKGHKVTKALSVQTASNLGLTPHDLQYVVKLERLKLHLTFAVFLNLSYLNPVT